VLPSDRQSKAEGITVPDTRNYGKFNPRFAEGGPVDMEAPEVPEPLPAFEPLPGTTPAPEQIGPSPEKITSGRPGIPSSGSIYPPRLPRMKLSSPSGS
jgi:hypothetical protein